MFRRQYCDNFFYYPITFRK